MRGMELSRSLGSLFRVAQWERQPITTLTTIPLPLVSLPFRSMNRWAGKVAVVTGASGGIGLATAVALVREGMIVVGIARRKALMEKGVEAAIGDIKGKFYAEECDISIEQDVIKTFQSIKKKFGTVHVLVNNAGIITPGSFLETSSEEWHKIFNVNVMGLMYCTKEALKLIKESNVEGHIVNINSVEGHRVHIYANAPINVYPASKHAVTGITETLQKENHGDKIRFTSISPGFVNSNIIDNNGFSHSTFEKLPVLQPEDIANAVVYVIGTPQRVQVHELTIRPLGERTT